jgi:hypothetical protein
MNARIKLAFRAYKGCGRETGDYKTTIQTLYLQNYKNIILLFYNSPFLCRTSISGLFSLPHNEGKSEYKVVLCLTKHHTMNTSLALLSIMP